MTTTTRSRILDVAYRAFIRHGEIDMSMRSIAEEVGLTPGALYKHFDDKDTIVEGIAERGFVEFEGRLAMLKRARDPVKSIRQLLLAYLQFALDEPHLFEVMFVSPRVRMRRFPADFVDGRSTTFNLLRQHVEEAMAGQMLRVDDSLEVARDLWAFTHGYVTLFRAGRFGDDRESVVLALKRAFPRVLHGLCPETVTGSDVRAPRRARAEVMR